MIEHFAGHFPLWLSPVHAAILPVAPTHEEAAAKLGMRLLEKKLRIEHMGSEESLGKRIRNGEQWRIPYLLVIGDKEIAEDSVTVRNVVTKQQVTIPIQEFIEKTLSDVGARALHASIGAEKM